MEANQRRELVDAYRELPDLTEVEVSEQVEAALEYVSRRGKDGQDWLRDHVAEVLAEAAQNATHIGKMQVLEDRLRMCNSAHDVAAILRHLRTTHDDVNVFQMAMGKLSPDQIRRLEGFFHDVILSEERSCHIQLRGSQFLARMTAREYTTGAIPSVESKDCPRSGIYMTIAHDVSFNRMSHGEPADFIRTVRRMVEDPLWRKRDFDFHLDYYGDVERMAVRTTVLLETRKPYLRLSELGRVIACHPHMAKNGKTAHVADKLKGLALAALTEVGLGSLRPAVEHAMPKMV